MKEIKLPQDLQAVVRRSILKRVIPCIALELILLTVLLLWGDFIFKINNNVGFKLFTYFLVLLIPFAITGVPFKMMDKTYFGTVERVEVFTSTAVERGSAAATRENWYTQNTVYLDIVTPNGKTLHKKVYSGSVKLQQNLNAYKAGDKVFHLFGTDNIVIIPSSADLHIRCAVCGDVNGTENTLCRHCGHTLIKSSGDFIS